MAMNDLKRMTNVEFMIRMMEYCPQGALVQPFIITALQFYSDMIIDMQKNNELPDMGFVDSDAWVAIAKYVTGEIDKKYSPNSEAICDDQSKS
jgi:hypothetical protein